MKKHITIILASIFTVAALSGCGSTNNTTNPTATASFDASKAITVISREDGSGTRGAFIELTGVQTKDANGTKIDRTTTEAEISNDTNVVITTVAGNAYAIGYISLGSLNDTVKALKVGGVDATVANVKAKTYVLSRPFLIVTKGEVTGLKKDFINFILSSQGQKVVADNNYIAIAENATAYTSTGLTGKIVVGGSSSVTPVMEKLAEAYKALNTGVTIEVQMSDSGTGITAATNGTVDIGMSSRELTDAEKAALTPTQIATDGLAIIVNKANTTTDLTKAQITSIYIGETTKWSDIK